MWCVERYPDLAWHVPGTGDYMVALPWRQRDDIAEIIQTRGREHLQALWTAFIQRRAGRTKAILVDPSEYKAAERFYHQAGVTQLEEILVLRTSHLPGPETSGGLDISPAGAGQIDELLSVDHNAFPWLWQNSRREFEDYLGKEDVRCWIGYVGDRPAGYISITDFGGWGHIDRLAVRADAQRRGMGTELLSLAMHSLHGAGARYVQLSTQGANARSQRLYSRFGFRITRDTFKLYGAYL